MAGTRNKIIHCINSLGTGGAEILLKNTIELLNEYEHVICYLNKPDDLLPYFQNCTVYCLQHYSVRNIGRTIIKLRSIIIRHNPEIIHAHLFDSTLIARLAKPSSIRFYFTIHNLLSEDAFKINKLSLFLEKLTYSKRQIIISVSNAVLKDYNEWVGVKGKSYVLYNFVQESFFNLSINNNRDIKKGLKLVAIGNLRRQKNYELLIESFTYLKDLPVSLDIYGSGDIEADLSKRIEKCGVNIKLKGRTNNVLSLLPEYDAYIMPSLFEGFGIAPMEAMAYGMPVLLSDIEVFKELAEEIPIYFNPYDSISMANAIKYAYYNWDYIKGKAAHGKSLILAKASKDVYINNLKKIYN